MKATRHNISITRDSKTELTVRYDNVKIIDVESNNGTELSSTIYRHFYNTLSTDVQLSIHAYLLNYLKDSDKTFTTSVLPEYTDDIGDEFTLDIFIDMIESGEIVDDDGFTGPILLCGRIWEKEGPELYRFEYIVDELKDLQEKYGKVSIIWYNK